MHSLNLTTKVCFLNSSEYNRLLKLKNIKGISIGHTPIAFKRANQPQGIIFTLTVDCLEIIEKCNVTTVEEIAEIRNEVNRFLQPAQMSVHDLHVTRIDYCYNEVESEYIKRQCIYELFNTMPADTYYLHQGRSLDMKLVEYKTGAHRSNKSRAFLLYDKNAERSQRNSGRMQPWEVNVIREELQLMHEKLKNLGDFDPVYKDRSFDKWMDLDRERDFLLQACKIFPYSDFWSKEKAKELILGSSYSNVIKKRLIEYVELVAEEKSMDKAFEKLGRSKRTVKDYIEKLEQLNVNPVTIDKKWHYSYIENPMLTPAKIAAQVANGVP